MRAIGSNDWQRNDWENGDVFLERSYWKASQRDNVLDFDLGDVIAVIGLDNEGDPALGVQWEESRRKPGRYLIYPHHFDRIPTPEQRPDLEWIDIKTPILYYGEVQDVFENFLS